MLSSKTVVNQISGIMKLHGLKHVVISPGSRNAPFILNFTEDVFFQCHSIADERSAAFYALGIAIQTNETVAICCTSGSAGLNFAPAIVEAFYQKVPLLVITADRPQILINQNDGQAMNQVNQYANFINHCIALSDDETEQIHQFNERSINEAILKTNFPVAGPVHLNVHLNEPLYERIKSDDSTHRKISRIQPEFTFQWENQLLEVIKKSNKILILVGQQKPNAAFEKKIASIAKMKNVCIFTETTSNIKIDEAIDCIDKVIDALSEREKSELKPDLLISTSGAIVSKKVKALFRNWNIHAHWHVGIERELIDSFGALTAQFQVPEEVFFSKIENLISPINNNKYFDNWQKFKILREKSHQKFMETCPYSDLYIFEKLLKWLPEDSDIHLANSTPVRYAQLFHINKSYHFYSNRGVSGIDGSISTASGFASQSDRNSIIISGDISFFYDSNALWNSALPKNLLIVIINNGGGNIFKIIPGPSQNKKALPYFETPQNMNAKGIAETYGIGYELAKNAEEMEQKLCFVLNNLGKKTQIFEIDTRGIDNENILKNFLSYFKNEIDFH